MNSRSIIQTFFPYLKGLGRNSSCALLPQSFIIMFSRHEAKVLQFQEVYGMSGMYEQKFLSDALQCSSIIGVDVPHKLEALKLPKENLVAFAINVDQGNENQRDSLYHWGRKFINGVAEITAGVAFAGIDTRILIIVTNVPHNNLGDKEKKNWSIRFAHLIKESVHKDLGMTVNIGISRVFNGHNGLGLAYSESAAALDDRFFKEPGTVTFVDDMCGLILTRISDEMLAFIEAADLKSVLDRLDQFYNYIENNIRPELCLYKRLAMNLLVQIYQFLLEIIRDGRRDEMANIKNIYERMEECKTVNETHDLITANIMETVQYLKSLRYKKYEVMINRASTFVDLHYAKNFGVPDIAAHLGICEGSFSRIFKKYTQKSFVQYLTEYRIEKAKKFLQSPDVKIYQVASLSGFNNDKYFDRIFKKHTNQTPSDYRKMHFL